MLGVMLGMLWQNAMLVAVWPERDHGPFDAAEVARLRAFRDRLRADPEFRRAYEACKRAVLAAGVTDSVAYSEAKGAFFEAHASG